jgi:hypothetical protein
VYTPRIEAHILMRGVSFAEQELKIDNLAKLAIDGYRLITPISHDAYLVEGKKGIYNPYTDTWT